MRGDDPVGVSADPDTATPGGMHAFTVTAKDNKGNTTTESRSYSVIVSYTFGGFAQPIDP